MVARERLVRDWLALSPPLPPSPSLTLSLPRSLFYGERVSALVRWCARDCTLLQLEMLFQPTRFVVLVIDLLVPFVIVLCIEVGKGWRGRPKEQRDPRSFVVYRRIRARRESGRNARRIGRWDLSALVINDRKRRAVSLLV